MQNLSQQISQNYDEAEKFNEFENSFSNFNNKLEIVFIGNSITLHGPAPDIGWTGNYGMAASKKNNDYCHLLLRLLNFESDNAFVGNFADIERTNIAGTNTANQILILMSKKPLLTVIQLGDNVGSNYQFEIFIKNLYAVALTAKHNCKNVLLLSTWWESQAKDDAIKNICDLLNLKFIYIGDLFGSELNSDRKVKQFTHSGVDNHPRDWAMKQIAHRIYSAVMFH